MRHFLTICVFALMSSGQAQLPSYVPTQDLVAWYPMNNSGDDFSGNGFHGEVIGSTFTHDRFGSELSSAYFDWSAVDGYGNPWHRIEINPGFDGTLNGTFTVAAWIRPEHYYWPQNSAHSAMIFGYASRCPNTAGLRFSIEGEGALRLRWGNNAISDEGAVVLNEWQHVVGTIAQDSMRVYINGVQVGSAPAVEGPTSGCFNIGELHQANGHWYYFDGAIDDLGVWDHALSESEISALYNSEGIILSCTDPAACNYEPTATQDDGSCDYTCCPGPGCCDVGMHWDWELGMCQITNVADTNLDGCVQLNDLLDVLSAYGDCGVLENEVQVISNPNFEIADGIYNQWPELTIALRAAFSDSTGSSNIYRQIEGGEMGLNHSDGKLSFSLKASNGNCFTAAGWVAVETDLTDDDLHSIIARYSRLTGEFSLAIDGEIMVVSAINSGDLADCNLYNGEIGFPSDKAWSLEEIGFYDFVWSEEMVASYTDCVPLTSLDMESAQLILPSGVSIDEVEELLSPYAPITVTGTSGFLPCE